MAKEKDEAARESGAAPDNAALARENAELRAALLETNRRLDSVLSQREYNGDRQQVINVNLPNNPHSQAEQQKRFDAMSTLLLSKEQEQEAELATGPRHFRICILDRINIRTYFPEGQDAKAGAPSIREPWTWKFNPFNPWRTVGARDSSEAQDKYRRFFGIEDIGDGARLFSYECDADGQPMRATVAA